MEMFVFLEDNDLWQEVVHPRKSPSSSLEPPGSPHFLLRSTWNYVFDHSDITNHVFSQFPQQEAKKNPHFLIFPRLTRKIYSPVKGKGAGISSSPSTFGRRRSELPPFFFLVPPGWALQLSTTLFISLKSCVVWVAPAKSEKSWSEGFLLCNRLPRSGRWNSSRANRFFFFSLCWDWRCAHSSVAFIKVVYQ